MTKQTLFILSASLLSIGSAQAENGVCHHCEDIRLYNSKNHHNFEYFEDYAKSNDPEKDKNYDDANQNDKTVTERKPAPK